MHVGVIGLGRMGSIHAGICARSDAVQRLSVYDHDAGRAHEAARAIGAEVLDSVDAVLQAVDAVIIATRTDSHAELVEAAVRAGRATFTEKPIALDLATTNRIVSTVIDAEGRVQVGFQRRFDPAYAAARALVSSGGLGDLYLVRANAHDHEPASEKFVATSGGIFRDFVLHDLDLIRFITGEDIVEVYADGACLIADHFGAHGDVDVASVLVRLGSGAQATITCTRHNARGHDVRLELFGSRDNVSIGHDARSPLRPVDGEPAEEPYHDFLDRFRDAYVTQMHAFLAFASSDSDSPCGVDEAAEAMRVALACDRSRAERRPVRIEEFR